MCATGARLVSHCMMDLQLTHRHAVCASNTTYFTTGKTFLVIVKYWYILYPHDSLRPVIRERLPNVFHIRTGVLLLMLQVFQKQVAGENTVRRYF